MSDDSKLIPFSGTRRSPDPARVEEFAATARKLQQERASAEEVVERVRAELPRVQWSQSQEMARVGVLDRLAREIEEQLDRDPREALDLTELATTLAAGLRPYDYPPVLIAQVRAQAWKDRAQALCYLSRHEEALRALDQADAYLEDFGTLAHDQAIVRFVRATTLAEMNRLEEAMKLLAESRAIFDSHGDSRRVLLCGIAEGAFLHRLRRFREARDVYTSLLDTARELRDEIAEAYLHHDIGYTSVELHDLDTAEKHLDRAVKIFGRLKQPLNACRSEVVRGVLFARRGEYRRASWHIGKMREQFLDHGLVEEAGVFGLEMVDARLALGDYEDAATLARQIVAEFVAANLNVRAITALGYLTEVIAARKASSATVNGVREYLVSLRKNPEREFVACA